LFCNLFRPAIPEWIHDREGVAPRYLGSAVLEKHRARTSSRRHRGQDHARNKKHDRCAQNTNTSLLHKRDSSRKRSVFRQQALARKERALTPSKRLKLSPAGPIVLYAKVCGRVGSCRHKIRAIERNLDGHFLFWLDLHQSEYPAVSFLPRLISRQFAVRYALLADKHRLPRGKSSS
jgi:hypothetical protein